MLKSVKHIINTTFPYLVKPPEKGNGRHSIALQPFPGPLVSLRTGVVRGAKMSRTDAFVRRQLVAQSRFPLPFPVYVDWQDVERHVWVALVIIRTTRHCTARGRHAYMQRRRYEKHDKQATILRQWAHRTESKRKQRRWKIFKRMFKNTHSI